MTLETIRKIGYVQPDREAVENAAIAAVIANPEPFFRAYRADPRSFEGKYVSADLFKERFSAYNASPEARNRYNNPVHNAAAVLASEQLRRAVANDSDLKRDTVIFLTGIPGAGKTTTVLGNKEFPARFRAVYEGQLSRPAPAIPKIQAVVDAGLKAEIFVVHARPETALSNTLTRFAEYGRGASINTMADIQGNLPDGLKMIRERFGEKVTLLISDRRDYAKPILLEGWKQLDLLRSEGNADHVKQRLLTALESIRPTLNEAAYGQARGNAPLDIGSYLELGQNRQREEQRAGDERGAAPRRGTAPVLGEGGFSETLASPGLRLSAASVDDFQSSKAQIQTALQQQGLMVRDGDTLSTSMRGDVLVVAAHHVGVKIGANLGLLVTASRLDKMPEIGEQITILGTQLKEIDRGFER
jgi:hypothetical protein